MAHQKSAAQIPPQPARSPPSNFAGRAGVFCAAVATIETALVFFRRQVREAGFRIWKADLSTNQSNCSGMSDRISSEICDRFRSDVVLRRRCRRPDLCRRRSDYVTVRSMEWKLLA